MTPRPDLRLVAIVGPPVVSPSDILEASRAAEAGGVTALQIRWKDAPAGALLELTRALVNSLSIPVFVNDRADVAWAAGAHGVHVGADDLPADRIRAVSPIPLCIGVSVGDEPEAAAAQCQAPDYWSVGSVFATSTKPNAGAPIGIRRFRELSVLAPQGMPVIAIGGITAGNVSEVLNAGAAGVALSGGVFATADVTGAAQELRALVDAGAGHPPLRI